MARTASYIVASYQRPHIVGYCLDALAASRIPCDWDLEIVVCVPKGDPGRDAIELAAARAIDRRILVRIVSAEGTDVGSQFEHARQCARGELIMLCGDDDFQSPEKAYFAIRAHEDGAVMSGFDRFLFVDAATGAMALWRGPAYCAGGTMSFRADLLERAGGWSPCRIGNDGQIRRRIQALGYDMDIDTVLLPVGVGRHTVYLQHGANLSSPRPFPAKGDSIKHGSFEITGVGHWRDVQFSPAVAAALEATCIR